MTLHRLSAREMVQKIRAGETTSEQLACSCLDRIETREGAVGAWQYLAPHQVLAQARKRDHEDSGGPLHGVPVGVKDLFDTADMPTAYGSDIYRDHRPSWDAAVVAALREAGAVILGKTVTTEFAAYRPGKTANPHNLDHTPGGSSSGSAAAVADDMVPLALGSQTAGSVIRPASFCGVVGYKPTFGWVPRAGMKSMSESLDTVGGFARSVEDAALLVAVMAGRPELGSVIHPKRPPRVGLCRTPQWEHADAETAEALEHAAERLRSAGATVVNTVLPAPFQELVRDQEDVMAYEAARGLAFERCVHGDRLSAKLIALFESGDAVPPERYDEALQRARSCRAALSDVCEDLDALLVPSAPGEAPRGLVTTGDPIFCRVWTLLHAPCVNLPGLRGPQGLPVGIQLVAPPGADTGLLAAARWIEPHLS